MKKYWILFGVTICVALGIVWLEAQTRPVIVKTLSLREETAQLRIHCSGKITEANRQGIYTEIPVIAKNIAVQEGDYVKKGDLLFETNVEATVNALADYLDGANITSTELEGLLSTIGSPEIPSALVEPLVGKDLLSILYTVVQGSVEKYYAPFSGYVRSIHVDESSLNQTAVPAMVMSLSNRLQVELSVSESQISQIRRGQRAIVTGAGFRGSEYEGEISTIANTAKQEYTGSSVSTNVKVIVRMKDYGEDFKSGLTAQAASIVEEQPNALLIPYDALRCDADGAEFLYRVRDDRAEKCYVETQQEYAEGVCVKGGVEAGDLLILDPDKVKDGQKVIAIQQEVTAS